MKSVAKKGMQGWINTPPGGQVISLWSNWSLGPNELALLIWTKCCARKKGERLHSSCLPCSGCWPAVRAWRRCKGSRRRNTKWWNTVCMHLLCFLQIVLHSEWKGGSLLVCLLSLISRHTLSSYFCFSSMLTPVTSKGKYRSGKDASVLCMIKEEEHTKKYLAELKTLWQSKCFIA